MRKTVISIVLLAAFMFSIVPVHAASDTLTVNLLNSAEFYCRGYAASVVPSFKLTGTNEALITWSTSIPYECSKYVLGVYSSSVIEDIGFNGVLGRLIGNNGSYYQYEFLPGEDILVGSSSVKLEIRFEEDAQHNVNLVSFYGYQSNYLDVDQVDFHLMREYQVRDHEMLQFDTILDEEVSLPFSKEYYQLSWSGTPERLYYGISYVNIDPEDLGVQYLDSLQVQFSFTGVDYHSVRLIDKETGDTVTVLDYSYDHCSGDPFETMSGVSDYYVNMYHTLMNIDLSGVNLDGCYIQVVFSQSVLVWAAVTECQEGFFIRCDWARAILPNEDLPWYAVWGDWIADKWDRLFDWIDLVIEYIETGFSNVVDSIASWGQGVIDAIGDGAQNIIDALSPDTSGADQAGDQMDDIAGEMGGLIDEMEQGREDRPDVDGDISGIIDIDGLSSDTHFFAILLNQPLIKAVMTLSLILMTGSYVLFGKRG